jgi:tRNA(Arg) A34 adenosine deaminase TadA
MTHQDHLRRALELAADHSSDGKHGPFGAVVVKGDEVVGEGWNQVVAGADPTAHAGFDDSVILGELKRGWVERKIDGNQALREEGLRVLQAWTKNPKKQEY